MGYDKAFIMYYINENAIPNLYNGSRLYGNELNVNQIRDQREIMYLDKLPFLNSENCIR